MKDELRTNFRVVIEPKRLGDFGIVSVSDSMVSRGEKDRQKQYRERCDEIINDVKRHVDAVGDVYIESDVEYFCEHCGSVWTECGAQYNGGCCDKDQADQDARELPSPRCDCDLHTDTMPASRKAVDSVKPAVRAYGGDVRMNTDRP